MNVLVIEQHPTLSKQSSWNNDKVSENAVRARSHSSNTSIFSSKLKCDRSVSIAGTLSTGEETETTMASSPNLRDKSANDTGGGNYRHRFGGSLLRKLSERQRISTVGTPPSLSKKETHLIEPIIFNDKLTDPIFLNNEHFLSTVDDKKQRPPLRSKVVEKNQEHIGEVEEEWYMPRPSVSNQNLLSVEFNESKSMDDSTSYTNPTVESYTCYSAQLKQPGSPVIEQFEIKFEPRFKPPSLPSVVCFGTESKRGPRSDETTDVSSLSFAHKKEDRTQHIIPKDNVVMLDHILEKLAKQSEGRDSDEKSSKDSLLSLYGELSGTWRTTALKAISNICKLCYDMGVTNIRSSSHREDVCTFHHALQDMKGAMNAIANKNKCPKSQLDTIAFDLSVVISKIGKAFTKTEQYEAALVCFAEALKVSIAKQKQELKNKNVCPDVQVAMTLNELSSAHYFNGESKPAIYALKESIHILKQKLGVNHPDVALGLSNLGLVYFCNQEFSEAKKCYEESLYLRVNALGSDSIEVGHIHKRFGDLWKAQGKMKKAYTAFNEALRIYRLASNLCLDLVADVLDRLGAVSHELQGYDTAMVMFQEALDIKKKLYGEDEKLPTEASNSLLCIATRLYEQKDYDLAIKNFLAAADIRRKKLGRNHLSISYIIKLVAKIHFMREEYDKSLEMYKDVLFIQKSQLGGSNLDVASTLYAIGKVHANMKNYSDALKCFEEVRQTREIKLGLDSKETILILKDIARLHMINGDDDVAVELWYDLLPLCEDLYGNEDKNVGTVWNHIGVLHYNLGEYYVALQAFSKAFDILSEVLGEDHIDIGEMENFVGLVMFELGDYDEALSSFHEALRVRNFVHGQSHMSVVHIVNNIATTLLWKGTASEALELYERVLQKKIDTFGMNKNMSIVFSLNNVGDYYFEQQEYSKALESFRWALEVFYVNSGGADDDRTKQLILEGRYVALFDGYRNRPSLKTPADIDNSMKLPILLSKLSCLHSKLNNPRAATEANDVYLRIWDLFLNIKESKSTLISSSKLEKKAIDIMNNKNDTKKEDAIKNIYESIRIKREELGCYHVEHASSHNLLAECYRAMGKRVEAIKSHRKALKFQRLFYGSTSYEAASTMSKVADCLHDMGQFDRSSEYYARAMRIKKLWI